MNIAIMQRQLRINAQVIQGLSDELTTLKYHRKAYYEADEPEQAKIYTPYIRKFERKLDRMHEMQKALKVLLKEAYYWESL